MGTIDKQVGAGGDDYYWAPGGSFAGGNAVICAWNTSGTAINLGVRFTGLDIPAEATITAAHVDFSRSSTSGSEHVGRLYGVKADDPAAPTNAGEADGEALTTAYVAWDEAWASGWNESPDIKTIIQELADLGYLTGGKAVIIEIHDNGSGGDERV